MSTRISNQENELLSAVAAGSHTAFQTVYNEYYTGLVAFAHKLTGNLHDAEDITVQTFVKLYEHPPEFKGMAHLRRWLFMTVRNASIDVLRKARLVQTQVRDVEQAWYHTASLEAVMTEDELLKRLELAIAALPEQRRRIFLLSYMEGYKAKEIAALLGITENTVNTQKKRALVSLRTSLGLTVFYLIFFR